MKRPTRLNKEKLGNVSSRTGIARKLRTEEEEVLDWHAGNQMERQWDEDEKLEVILERGK